MNEGMILAIDYEEFLAKESKDILSILTKKISDQFYCARYHNVQGARHSTVKQKYIYINKINSLLTCLRRVHSRGMAAGFL